ncbi:unnamed protein product [Periconia digitata]|uniref:Uncharacterized protein n=1 Tax=Periconia digitata TaxID=1303443 RepID=A0A9W4XS08_9PLEO|nr:unnamed protein product [Periconia digitata]
MSPPPLAMSESKAVLMSRLGLSGPGGEQIYKMLLDEASIGRDRLSCDSKNLTVYSRTQSPPAQQPYKWDELSETARHHEILMIVSQAGQYTKPYYAMGYYKRATEENWVAQWFLWHCFRYRDNRPRNTMNNVSVYRGRGTTTQFYDPIYNAYRR